MNDAMQAYQNIKGTNFLEFVFDFYNTMKSREITLVYEGEITHDITRAFASLAESNVADESTIVQKRVYHVMIECLQNISRHADNIKINNTIHSSRGILLVSKAKAEYSITTGNAVDNNKREVLREMLDRINNMSREEIWDLYDKQISEGELSDKGGAGLGFIDIVKKTGRKLDYHFLDIDEKTSFFILTSFISR